VARGLRSYPWIDRYCIQQHDEAKIMALIAQMGGIYASSTFTIIAVAGDRPEHGLPGASTTERDGLLQPLQVTVGLYILVHAARLSQRI
jgi:hypothetical protein